ncbi:MAG: primosomal protein N' [Oscillospiraceae bacterium]|nr:primosomal protein N' [Oscillospiraceae bacterium]MDD4368093.1 primosomal protein N' [Oscillospiraceae bacterium]
MLGRVFLMDSQPAFDRLYTYQLPELPAPQVWAVGLRLQIPFGRQNHWREAVLAEVLTEAAMADLKPNLQDGQLLKTAGLPLDPYPVLNLEQLKLCAQLRIRYACTWGEACRQMIPPGLGGRSTEKKQRVWIWQLQAADRAAAAMENGEIRYENQARILEYLLEHKQAASEELLHACQVTLSTLRTLEKKQLLTHYISKQLPDLSADQGRPDTAGSALATAGQPSASKQAMPAAGLTLTGDQQHALARLQQAIRLPARRSGQLPEAALTEFLLKGITGSGKTEVYLQLAATVLAQGRSVLMLVPEISLTPLMTERFISRFGSQIAVLHSRLTSSQRLQEWKKIRSGQVAIVVGARSAVFAPLPNLGLIILDEEHDSSYQSDHKPRYHARTVARLRARATGALLLLGSATPSFESYARVLSGRSTLLQLNHRPAEAHLPRLEVIDMRQVSKADPSGLFSQPLYQALTACFERGEQAVLFLNRRGYAPLWLCPACGFSVDCPNCSVALTYHQPAAYRPAQLRCHYCGYLQQAPAVCPECGQPMTGWGMGTEQAEVVFKQLFPRQQILRMDQDTTTARSAHKDILEAFRRHEADALLGTQMIAKGHDFPLVTVAGILSADLLFRENDFRAEERAYQLLTQTAGRAGRADLAGQVFIQAYEVDNEALKAACSGTYEQFFALQQQFRQALQYPPYSCMGTALVSHPNEKAARELCQSLEASLRAQWQNWPETRAVRLTSLGCSSARLPRLNGRSRWQFTLRSQSERLISQCLNYLARQRLPKDSSLALSMDPA